MAPLEEVLRERLAGTDLTVTYDAIVAIDLASVVTPGPSDDSKLARVWVDFTTFGRVTLYIVDGTWERVLIRHTASSENPEVTREGLGHIVEFALLALRAGQRIGIGRDSAREQLLPSVPAPRTPPLVVITPITPPQRDFGSHSVAPRARPLTLHGGVFYEAIAYGGGLDIASGPGLSIGLAKRERHFGYGFTATAQYRLPSFAVGTNASIRTEGGALRAMASIHLPLTNHTDLTPALGAGVDLVDFEATGTRISDVRFANGSFDVIPVLRAALRIEHKTDHLRLHFGGGVDVPTHGTHYVLQRQSDRDDIFAPWAVRPFLFAGVETP